jgi:hypothetical protein
MTCFYRLCTCGVCHVSVDCACEESLLCFYRLCTCGVCHVSVDCACEESLLCFYRLRTCGVFLSRFCRLCL